MAGATPVLAVDAWDLAADTYKSNFPDAEVICSPIEKLKPKELAKCYFPDVLLTSPECTSHSIARGAKPKCERSRETAIGIIPWIEAMNPRWLIVENVNRMKQWERHNELISAIETYGYKVNDLLLNAANFGTPQSRKRMFLVCDRDGSVITGDDLHKMHHRCEKSARSIIDRTGKYKSNPLYKPSRAQATIERAERAMKALGRNKDFIIVYYGSDYAGGWQSLDSPTAHNHNFGSIRTGDLAGRDSFFKNAPAIRIIESDGSKPQTPAYTWKQTG